MLKPGGQRWGLPVLPDAAWPSGPQLSELCGICWGLGLLGKRKQRDEVVRLEWLRGLRLE